MASGPQILINAKRKNIKKKRKNRKRRRQTRRRIPCLDLKKYSALWTSAFNKHYRITEYIEPQKL